MVTDNHVAEDFSDRVLNKERFHLRERLGSGGFGVVYHAYNLLHQPYDGKFRSWEPPLNTPEEVAIKVIKWKGVSAEHRQRALDEVDFHFEASQFASGVLPFYGYFFDGDHIFLVMQYCPEGDLCTLIGSRDYLTGQAKFWMNTQLVKSVILRIINTMARCHKRGIYHFDLKPENVLCDMFSNKVYISDFGLASRQHTSPFFRVGTYTYMSPECIADGDHFAEYSSESNDVWALVLILFAMVTCDNPWDTAIWSDPLYRRYIMDPNSMRERYPISKGFDMICRKTLWQPAASRMSLTDLAITIENLESFWMTEDEIMHATWEARLIAEYCGNRSYAPPSLLVRKAVPKLIRSPTPWPARLIEPSFIEEDQQVDSPPDSDGPATPKLSSLAPNTGLSKLEMQLEDLRLQQSVGDILGDTCLLVV